MSPILLTIAWLFVSLGMLLAIRLARSAQQTGEWPEWLMAAFFGGACLGYACTLVVTQLEALPEAAIGLVHGLGRVAMQVPPSAIALFTWQVFRRDDARARALAWVIAGTLFGGHAVGTWVGPPLGIGWLSVAGGQPLFWITNATKAVAFAWACAEALRYWRLSRRRLALGLSDPLITNRFLLWAIWSGSAAAILAVRTVDQLFATSETATPPPPIVVGQLVFGLACVGAVWLTFASPVWYRRRLAGAAPA